MQNLMDHSNAIHGTKKLRRRANVYTESNTHKNNLCVYSTAKPTITQWLTRRWAK